MEMRRPLLYRIPGGPALQVKANVGCIRSFPVCVSSGSQSRNLMLAWSRCYLLSGTTGCGGVRASAGRTAAGRLLQLLGTRNAKLRARRNFVRVLSGSADSHLWPVVLTGDCGQQLLNERGAGIGVGQNDHASSGFGECNHEATVSGISPDVAIALGFTRSGNAKAEAAAPGELGSAFQWPFSRLATHLVQCAEIVQPR